MVDKTTKHHVHQREISCITHFHFPFVPPGEICAEPRSDTFTLYSDLGGVTEAAWFPTAAATADEDDMEEDPSCMDCCCKGSTPMESQPAEAATAVEAAAAA